MKATVLVEKLRSNKYRAVTAQPIPLEAVGASAEVALARLADLARRRLAAGQLCQIDLPGTPAPSPWQTCAGIWQDHPEIEAFVDNVAKYRRAANRRRSSA